MRREFHVRFCERAAVGFLRATHLVVGFEHEADARRFWEAMRKRLQEFSLTLHPEKTRLIEFGRCAAANRERRGLGKPETFNFLGFVFICGKSRRGNFLIKRKSRRDRMRAKLSEVRDELRRRMHQTIPEQGKWLRQVVTGFFVYHAVPTNGRALVAFRFHVVNLWRRSLIRRSQKDRTTWERITRLADDWQDRAGALSALSRQHAQRGRRLVEPSVRPGRADHARGDPGANTTKYRRKWGKPMQSVRSISEAELQIIYRDGYWDKVAGDLWPKGPDQIVFDIGVNSGPARGLAILGAAMGTAERSRASARQARAREPRPGGHRQARLRAAGELLSRHRHLRRVRPRLARAQRPHGGDRRQDGPRGAGRSGHDRA